MTTYSLDNNKINSFRHLFLHSSNLLTVALMEMKLGTHAYDIISKMTTLNNKIASGIYVLLHSSNLLTAAHMEMKLGTHAYYIRSMTTTGIFLYY